MYPFITIFNTIISTVAIMVIILIILRAKGEIQGTRGTLDTITIGVTVICFVLQFLVMFILVAFYGFPEGYMLQPASFFVGLSGVFYLFGHSHWDERKSKEEQGEND